MRRLWRRPAFAVALAFTLAVTHVALWVLPFESVRAALRAGSGLLAVLAGRDACDLELGGAVAAVNRRMFGTDACLTEGMVTEALLQALGRDAVLRIGVARRGRSGFDAHAWVECGGRVVIGAIEGISRYAPLENGALQRGLATWLARPGRAIDARKA